MPAGNAKPKVLHVGPVALRVREQANVMVKAVLKLS